MPAKPKTTSPAPSASSGSSESPRADLSIELEDRYNAFWRGTLAQTVARALQPT